MQKQELFEMNHSYEKLIKIITLLFFLLWIGYDLGNKMVLAEEFRIVAVVNNEVVTSYDLDQTMNLFKGQLEQIEDLQKRQTTETKGRNDLLEELIRERLLEQEMNRLGVGVSGPEVDQEFNRVVEKSGLTRPAFEQGLMRQGIALDKYQNSLRDHLKLLKFIRMKISPKVKVDDKTIQDYYEQNRAMFMEANRTHLYQVNLTNQKAKNKHDLIRSDLLEGKPPKQLENDFPGVAVLDLGVIVVNDLSPEVSQAVTGVGEGQISSTIKKKKNWYIFKVEKSFFGEEVPLEKVQEQIRGNLIEMEIRQQLDSYISDLRRSAHIEIRL
jgi:parvulin-like peptidyl-prolyl isomerase